MLRPWLAVFSEQAATQQPLAGQGACNDALLKPSLKEAVSIAPP